MGAHAINRYSIAEAGLGLVFLLVPGRLRWSRRSRRVLRLAAAGLIGVPLIRQMRGWDPGVERASAAFIGLTLGGGQYLLSEEDSSVRGAIAALGGGLMLWALLTPDASTDEEYDV